MSPDGPRHVLLAFLAIVGGVPLFGLCLLFFTRLLPKWLAPDHSEFEKWTWRQRLLGLDLPLRDLMRHQWVDTRTDWGAFVVFCLSGAVTATYVWLLLRFW
jgi:hypothetical protein